MTRKRSRCSACGQNDHLGLIPPHELFGRVLPVPRFLDADLPFEEQVERAWARLLAGFREDEHERLRERLVEVIEDDRRGVMPAKGGET